MADYQQNFLASLGAGYNFGQRIKQQRDQGQLNQLASLAYSAPREQRGAIGSQIAALNPEAAQAQRKAWAADDESDQKELIGMARFIKAAPPEQQQKAYQNAVLPRLRARGMDAPDWTPETQGTILQTVDALVGALNGGKANNPYDGLPADIQSLQLLRDNPELAKMDRERRQAAGMVPKMVETSSGIGWGTPGGGIQLAPLEGVAGGGAPSQQTQAPQLFAALGQKYGIQPTSVLRTPERNRQVGGVSNSYHLTGQAADWPVPAQYKAQFMADARANGFEAIDEGDHIHIEPASRNAARGGIAQPYQAPAREESAPSGYRKTADGNLEIIPGGPADKSETPSKPMPASILRMQRESREALSVSQGLASSIDNIRQQLKDGKIKLGPIQNLAYAGLNAAGQSTEASRNYQGMRSTFEKMRNDSLRLNKGVQTEGDAERAWNELLGNLNDAANVDQQLSRIQEINDRAIQLHTENMDEIQAEYGARNAPGRSAAPAQAGSDFSNLWN